MTIRNPWTWPLLALIAILVVVTMGVIFALLFNGGGYAKQCTDAGGKIIGGECYVPGYQQLN